ncbi:MAG: heavy metal translocating P-type ATPase [Chloroflexi bacterium]|nr:heavy metal translocating P-type ATPase [Chloroflexota bacterium]
MTATAPDRASDAALTLPVAGLDCAMCAESLAAGLRATPGVRDASVNFGGGNARVDIDPTLLDRAGVVSRIQTLGYTVPAPAPAISRFRIAGMDCADCALSVERVVAALPGVDSARVNFGAATLTVVPATGAALPEDEIARTVARAGYQATAATGAQDSAAPDALPWWRDRRLQWVLLAAALWILGSALSFAGVQEPLATALFAGAIASGGWPFARAAAQSARLRRLDMNVLMSVSAIGAAVLGEWGEGAAVVVLFALGGALQTRTLERTRGAIRGLMALSPATASRVDAAGAETEVPVDVLAIGDLVRVRPGERIPADGIVVEGISAVDQSPITGESMPADKAPGDDSFAGTVNGPGALLLRVSREAADSTLARVIHLVEEAQGSKAPAQQMVDRFAAVYTPAVIVGAALLALGGSLVTDDPRTWIYRALALLVIACPCALVISTPVSIVSAIGAASRRGILIKGGAALEAAGTARVVAIDKTGTLTTGRPEVVAVEPLPGGAADRRSLLEIAAAVEALSEHPLARAVMIKAREEGIGVPAADGFLATPGKGASARVGGREVIVGSIRLARELALTGTEQRPSSLAREMTRLAEAGSTPLFVAIADDGDGLMRPLGVIAVADRLRPHAADAVCRMREAGIAHVAVLTGDTRATGEAIARAVGADSVLAELLPEEKAAAVRDLRARYGMVVMVGDGVNDAPALATADVGIAMGAAGTDVALETADIALMGDDLNGVAEALELSRRTSGVIRQNIGLSLATKLVALVLAAFGFVNLWIAVAADMGTSLAVTLNGMRLALRRHMKPASEVNSRPKDTPTNTM